MTIGGVESVQVVLTSIDGASKTLKSGCKFQGKVIVICRNKSATIRSVGVRFVGQIVVDLARAKSVKTSGVDEEFCLDETLTVWSPLSNVSKELSEGTLKAGQHVFNFKHQLPVQLPSSIDHSEVAKIEYRAVASLYLLDGRHLDSSATGFEMVAGLSDPRQSIPFDTDVPKENWIGACLGQNTCLGRSPSLPLELGLILKQSVVRPGGKVVGRVLVDVEDTGLVANVTAAINEMLVLLVQEWVYSVGGNRVTERFVVAECSQPFVYCSEGNAFQLKVDEKVELSSFPWCSSVYLGYSVQAVAKTGRGDDDIVIKLPLFVANFGEDVSKDDKEEDEESEKGKVEESSDEESEDDYEDQDDEE